MDISVSQLNHRLALQLPAELPLGLVFVTGTVRNLEGEDDGGNGRIPFTSFDLEQKGHRLHCKLAPREAEKITLREQLEVRLGGHLTFDPRRAEYYLLARDVEVIGGMVERQSDPLAIDLSELVEDQAAFAAALAGIKRRADLSRQTPAEMPVWVQKIAPPEVQENQSVEEPEMQLLEPATPSRTTAVLNDELVSYLSALMESEEEVELTPDILAQWTGETKEPVIEMLEDEPAPTPASLTEQRAEHEMEATVTAVSPYAPVGDASPKPRPARPKQPQPRPQQQTDWPLILLLVAVILFAIVILSAIIFLR